MPHADAGPQKTDLVQILRRPESVHHRIVAKPPAPFGNRTRAVERIIDLRLRFGQVHRNTYINAPSLLDATLQLRTARNIFFAGQISGVEGYVESIATGLVAGLGAAAHARGESSSVFPRQTAIGSLCWYVSAAESKNYQPANITFDLLPKLENPPRDKKVRQTEVCRRALAALEEFRCAHV